MASYVFRIRHNIMTIHFLTACKETYATAALLDTAKSAMRSFCVAFLQQTLRKIAILLQMRMVIVSVPHNWMREQHPIPFFHYLQKVHYEDNV